MPDASLLPKRDPLSIFMAGAIANRATHPVPLVEVGIDVEIEAGLAVVTMRRVFRNAEDQHIEAALTFPVPVNATLFELEAKFAERTLVAKAQPKAAARGTYEGAIQEGQSAVLHEELLKGLHMLSIANLAPGATVDVTARWASALTVVNGEGHLRIPMTMGEIYGTSALPDSDDLVLGGMALTGTLQVQCRDGRAELAGGRLENGRAMFDTDRQVDLVVKDWAPRVLTGRSATGRQIDLQLTPVPSPGRALNVAVLVDHSGSMGNAVSSAGIPVSKHATVTKALTRLASRLRQGDEIDLWEFAYDVRHVGNARFTETVLDLAMSLSKRRILSNLVSKLSTPAGGTEIGLALARVLAVSKASAVLLITDGQTHALDVQALAQHGRPIFVVLVGEDSLEAKVGHLAALSGGQIFVSAGADLVEFILAATDASRRMDDVGSPDAGYSRYQRPGLLIDVREGSPIPVGESTLMSRAVAAYAAGLRLSGLAEATATELAVAEGLVTHLTSLVLVDDRSGDGSDTPALRKIALPEARVLRRGMNGVPEARQVAWLSAAPRRSEFISVLGRVGLGEGKSRRQPASSQSGEQLDAGASISPVNLALSIDWGTAPELLLASDLAALSASARDVVKRASLRPEIISAAAGIGIAPVMLALGLLADIAAAQGNRHAARLAKKLLDGLPRGEIALLQSSILKS